MLRLPQEKVSQPPFLIVGSSMIKNAQFIVERSHCMRERYENRKRPIERKVRFTPDEDRQVKMTMEEMGVKTFQSYAKNMLVQGQVVQIDFSELKDLRVAINRIGGNINQIAKHANENDLITIEEISEVMNLLSEIKDLVNAKVSSEEKRSIVQKKQIVRTYDEW